ncbi:sigma-54-dependent Fis family transcriptional regulator [Candidatus Sumerlaeota bacterium]|nr:sigma-54-dependent Fis family transcriptional regulator [Candidatus Sumerlaeota bacterium]
MKSTVSPSFPVLIVDDEEMTLKSCEVALLSYGMNQILCCQDSRNVMNILAEREMGVIMLDLSMPYLSGEELLNKISLDYPEIPVIIITGANDVETAVKCMRNGAFDYMVKPIERNRLISGVRRALELKDLQKENILLKKQILSDDIECPEAFDGFITNNKALKSIFKYVEAISKTRQPVLITGETGVGKELMATAVHTLSGLHGEFVPINVAGLDDNVFADALFGHKRGAFTGADQSRSGLVEKASEGTLFLDEIGDLSLASQVKLLRLLQEKEYFPLGSDVAKRADTRIIVATNQDLQKRLKTGRFRKDLYYRLRTHHVHIPPLREHKDDLSILVDYFLEEASRSLGKKKPTPPKEIFTLLNTYNFPGNVRELKSMIFDAVSKHRSKMLSLEAFKSYISPQDFMKLSTEEHSLEPQPRVNFSDMLPSLRETNHLLIEEALKRAKGNQTIAARMLGITQQALSKRLRRLKE